MPGVKGPETNPKTKESVKQVDASASETRHEKDRSSQEALSGNPLATLQVSPAKPQVRGSQLEDSKFYSDEGDRSEDITTSSIIEGASSLQSGGGKIGV